jgi:glutamate-1-semialdehyde 2,1-aminomutase
MATSTPMTRPSIAVRSNVESEALLLRGARVTPGGVNTARRKISPPLCLRRAHGSYVEDLDGNRYLDFHAAYGAILLGHGHPAVADRVRRETDDLILTGIGTTEVEVELAEKVVRHLPGSQQVVICGSGSEATFHAIRLSRAVTGRTKVIKFQGHYHGFHDYVLRNVMSTADRIGKRDPASAGMLPAAVDETVVCRYNDLESVAAAFAAHEEEIAALIVEPIAHNSPSILPTEGFLAGLRDLCDRHGALLVFDEVITGFRHHLGGYQSVVGVEPDLSTFAKALANGYPLALVAGRPELLAHLNTTETGNVTFAGTYNGNVPAVAAALATIEVLETEPVHQHLFDLGERMRTGLRRNADELGVPVVISGYGSLYVMLFMEGPLTSYEDVLRNDKELFVAYRRELVRNGVLEMPENIGRNHIMYSHTEDDIDWSLEVSRAALRSTLDAHTRAGAGK